MFNTTLNNHAPIKIKRKFNVTLTDKSLTTYAIRKSVEIKDSIYKLLYSRKGST